MELNIFKQALDDMKKQKESLDFDQCGIIKNRFDLCLQFLAHSS